MSFRPRHVIFAALAISATLAIAFASAIVGPRDPPAESVADAPAGRSIRIEYSLYRFGAEGEEILADTTDYAVATAANASGLYRLEERERYVPREVSLDDVRPNATHLADIALATRDPAELVPGAVLDFRIDDVLGGEDEVARGRVPRDFGPFPLRFTRSAEDVAAEIGRSPQAGDVVNATPPLRAVVEAVDGPVVALRVDVADGGAVVSKPLAAVFRVRVDESASEFRLRLEPVAHRQFRLTEPNPALGLPAGLFLWQTVTEGDAHWVSHPRLSPLYMGLDIRFIGRILDDAPRDTTLGHETHTQEL